jgi:transcription elongation factor GreA
MKEEAVIELIKSRPELKSSKEKLLAMEPGAYCVHRSWGFGQIKAYDEASKKLHIDFDTKPGHQMDPAFCASTMDVLPAAHLLVRKRTEPEVVEKLASDQPVELVAQLLACYPNGAATVIEVETVLSQALGEAKFKRWWATTRKALSKDPRIAVPAKKTECYVLREEPVSAEVEVLEEFRSTRSARRRILLAERLLEARHNQEIQASLPEVLQGLAAVIKESNQLTPAERLHGAWVRDDLAKDLNTDTSGFEPSLPSLISEPRELEDVAESLPTSLQTRMLELIKEVHPVQWKEIVFNLLKTSRGKFTTDCINFLIENGCSDELAATLTRWQTEQNLRGPVLMWIVKNRHSRKFSRLLHDLISPRLLSSIFFAIDYEALETAGTRRIPLAEQLSEDQELIPDLLSTADPETARDLANSLMLNQGFEELTKKSLLARFIRQFPGVQSLVAGESGEKEERLLVSRESYDSKIKEYETLVSKKIPENSKAIAAAREHGDLRENSEFKMAKQDQQVLIAQKAQLERELAHAQVTDFRDASTDQISVGSVVALHDQTAGRSVTYTILGAWDSNPEKNIISYKTPLGQSLLSKKAGESVRIQIEGSDNTFQIKKIERYVDLFK